MTISIHKPTLQIALIGATVGLVLMAFLFLFGSDASAAPVDVLTECDNKSKVCSGTDKNSLFGIITNIINLLLVVIGIIAVIMIIIGGFRYTTSAGDAGQTKSARDTIIYAVVGLVIAIMAYAIVNFVLSRTA